MLSIDGQKVADRAKRELSEEKRARKSRPEVLVKSRQKSVGNKQGGTGRNRRAQGTGEQERAKKRENLFRLVD